MAAGSLLDVLALLEAPDWQGAHAIAQQGDAPLACWAHGIVHIVEGDEAHARYWYAQANRPFPGMQAADAEIGALRAGLVKSA